MFGNSQLRLAGDAMRAKAYIGSMTTDVEFGLSHRTGSRRLTQ